MILFFFLLITGCGETSNTLPLPSSAKTISTNTIQIPFPYEESINGEQWRLDRDTSNHFVIRVLNEGKTIATFRFVEKIFVGTKTEFDYTSRGVIKLGGKKYKVIKIALNNDYLSGFLTLVKQ